MDEEQNVLETGIREGELTATEAEAKVGATISPFEPFSLGTPKSTGEAHLKVQIARLRVEAQERAHVR